MKKELKAIIQKLEIAKMHYGYECQKKILSLSLTKRGIIEGLDYAISLIQKEISEAKQESSLETINDTSSIISNMSNEDNKKSERNDIAEESIYINSSIKRKNIQRKKDEEQPEG